MASGLNLYAEAALLKKKEAKALHVRDCIIFQGKNLLRKENKKDGTGTWSNDPIWSSLALAKLSLVTKAPTLEGCRGGFAQNQNYINMYYHKVPDNCLGRTSSWPRELSETNLLWLLLLFLAFGIYNKIKWIIDLWHNDPKHKLSVTDSRLTHEWLNHVLEMTQAWLRDDSQTWLRDDSNMT